MCGSCGPRRGAGTGEQGASAARRRRVAFCRWWTAARSTAARCPTAHRLGLQVCQAGGPQGGARGGGGAPAGGSRGRGGSGAPAPRATAEGAAATGGGRLDQGSGSGACRGSHQAYRCAARSAGCQAGWAPDCTGRRPPLSTEAVPTLYDIILMALNASQMSSHDSSALHFSCMIAWQACTSLPCTLLGQLASRLCCAVCCAVCLISSPGATERDQRVKKVSKGEVLECCRQQQYAC